MGFLSKQASATVSSSGTGGGYLQVSKLAEIEPREVLLAKIAGGAKAPLFKAAGMFAAFNRNAANMFSQLLDKKESGEFVGAAAPDVAEEAPAAAAEEE